MEIFKNTKLETDRAERPTDPTLNFHMRNLHPEKSDFLKLTHGLIAEVLLPPGLVTEIGIGMRYVHTRSSEAKLQEQTTSEISEALHLPGFLHAYTMRPSQLGGRALFHIPP